MEAKALAVLLGPGGLRIVCSRLINLISQAAQKIRPWLEEDHAALNMFKSTALTSGKDLIKISRQCKSAEQVTHQARIVGFAMALIEMLLTASDEPILSMLFGYVPEICKPVGTAELKQAVFSDAPIWELFPVALAASMASDSPTSLWRTADFNLGLDAHANNAHLVALAGVRVASLCEDKSWELDFLA